MEARLQKRRKYLGVDSNALLDSGLEIVKKGVESLELGLILEFAIDEEWCWR